MSKLLLMDLRERPISAVEGGMSRWSAARLFSAIAEAIDPFTPIECENDVAAARYHRE